MVINVFAYLQFNWGRALCMLVLFSPLPHSSCPITNWSLAIKSVNSFFSKIRQSQINILFIAYDTQQHRWIKILSQHSIIRVVASTKDRININSNANVSIMFVRTLHIGLHTAYTETLWIQHPKHHATPLGKW